MGRLIKWLFIFALLCAIALAAYAYIGPIFGADFSPPQTEVRQPVDLDGN